MMLGTAITWNILALMKLLPSHSNLHYCDIAGIKIVIILMTEWRHFSREGCLFLSARAEIGLVLWKHTWWWKMNELHGTVNNDLNEHTLIIEFTLSTKSFRWFSNFCQGWWQSNTWLDDVVVIGKCWYVERGKLFWESPHAGLLSLPEAVRNDTVAEMGMKCWQLPLLSVLCPRGTWEQKPQKVPLLHPA